MVVAPTTTEVEVGVTDTPVTAIEFTVTNIVAVFAKLSADVAVMVHVPTPTELITPELLTVAMFKLLLVQFTV